MRATVCLIALLFCSCPHEFKKPKHTNPTPRVGEILSRDYNERFIVEENDKTIKWFVRDGECLYCYYYVTCDHQDRILSTWRQ